MSVASMFGRRVRGFRVVELIGLGVLLTLVLGVYTAKTFAGRERTEIAAVERQIEEEKVRIRLLQAEVAYLEQPRRIGELAAARSLSPIAPDHETTEEALIDIARRPAVAPPPVAATPPADLLAADPPAAAPAVPTPEAPR